MKRRAFITLLGAAAAIPVAASAQQPKVPVIGDLDRRAVARVFEIHSAQSHGADL